MGTYQNLLNTAQGVYQNAQGDIVPTQGTAPINDEQYAGISGVNQYANSAQPGLQTAQQLAYNAASPITSGQIQQYMSPYTQDVVNATESQFNNQNQQQQQQVLGNAISQGALGGNRSAIAQAETANQQQLAQAPVIAGLNNSAYNTGLNTALTEQQAGLSGALGLGNLASASQTAGLQGAGAQIGAGTTEQQTQQQELTNQYTQQMQQMGLPLQLAQWYAGIATGVGSQMGGTSSTTAPPPSLFAQLLGAGVAGAGIAGKTARGGAVNLASGGGVAGPSLMDQARDIGSLSDAMLGRNLQPQQPGVRGYDSGGGVANALGMNPFGSSGFIPGVQIVSGKGAPPPPQATKQPNPLGDFDKMYKAGQGLGTAYENSSLGDTVDDAVVDELDGTNEDDKYRGGVVRGYDDGGFVPDVKITEGSGAPPPPKPPSASGGSGGGILGSLISGIGSLGGAAVSALGEAAPEVGAALADAAPFIGLALRRGGGVRGYDDGGGVAKPFVDDLPDSGVITSDDPIDTEHNSGVLTPKIAKELRTPRTEQYAPFEDRFDNDVDAVRGVGSMEGKQKIAEAPVSTLRDHLNSEYGNDPKALAALNPAMQGSAVALAARPVSSDDTSSIAPAPAPVLPPGRDVADVRGSTAYGPPREAVEQMAEHIQKTGAPPDKPPGINPKFWDALISAGFSMMASRSPYLGVAIGQGGLAGMQSYTNATNLEAKNKLTQKQIDQKAEQLHNTIMNQQRTFDMRAATPHVSGEDAYGNKIFSIYDPKTGQSKPAPTISNTFPGNTQTTPTAGLPTVNSDGSPIIDKNGTPTFINPTTGERVQVTTPVLGPAPEDAKLPEYSNVAEWKGNETPIEQIKPAPPRSFVDDEGRAHGDLFLKQLAKTNPDIVDVVKQMDEGRQLPPTGMMLRTPYGRMLQTALSQYDPDFDVANAKTRAGTLAKFKYGKGADALTSFNTTIQHLGEFRKAVEDLGNYNTLPGFSNWVRSGFLGNFPGADSGAYQKALARFNTSRTAVTDELTRSFRMAGGNKHDIEAWEKNLNPTGSKTSQIASIEEAVHLLDGRIESVGNEFNRGLHLSRDPMSLLSPKAQETVDALREGKVPGTASRPSSPQPAPAPSINDLDHGTVIRRKSDGALFEKQPDGSMKRVQ